MRSFTAFRAAKLPLGVLATMCGACDATTLARDAALIDSGSGDSAAVLDAIGPETGNPEHDAREHAGHDAGEDARHDAGEEDAGTLRASTECAMAPELPLGEWVSRIPFDGDAAASSCGGRHAHFVRVDIGSATAAVVSMRIRGFTPAIGLSARCDASCTSSFTPRAGTTSFEYLASFTGERVLAVGAMGTVDAGASFDIRVTPLRSSTNGTCAAATPLHDGTALFYENVMRGAEATCSDETDALFYSVTIPPGERLEAAFIPSTASTNNIAVDVQRDCRARVCSSEIDRAVIGEQVTEDNTRGASPLTLIIGMRPVGLSAIVPSPVTVAASISAPRYTLTEVEAACEDVSSGSVVPGLGDDAVSGLRPFGFELPFFGRAYEHYVADSNGRVVLASGRDASPESEWINTPMPNPDIRLATVAPFWDDLAPSTAEGATPEIRAAELSGGRHIVQWKDFGFAPRPTARLTFQVIFSPGGTIELRYCRLDAASTSPPERQSGSSATIGLQSADGRAHVVGYARSGTAEVGRAHRFTPVVDR